jgi:hypothetical protein
MRVELNVETDLLILARENERRTRGRLDSRARADMREICFRDQVDDTPYEVWTHTQSEWGVMRFESDAPVSSPSMGRPTAFRTQERAPATSLSG